VIARNDRIRHVTLPQPKHAEYRRNGSAPGLLPRRPRARAPMKLFVLRAAARRSARLAHVARACRPHLVAAVVTERCVDQTDGFRVFRHRLQHWGGYGSRDGLLGSGSVIRLQTFLALPRRLDAETRAL